MPTRSAPSRRNARISAGVSPTPLSAEEVLAAGRAALPRLTALLGGVLDRL